MSKQPTILWTRRPKAAALLADCAANPPVEIVKRDRFGDTWTVYNPRDVRVRKLADLYANAQPPIDTPAWRVWLELTEQRAIAEAVAGALVLEAAE